MADDPAPLRDLVHDLRSPLMIVDGMASLLVSDDGRLSAEQRRDYAQRIAAAAAEMRALVDRAASG